MTVQIDMRQVVAETSARLGAQIGDLTAELVAQQQSNMLLHQENDRLRQALAAAEGEAGEHPETDPPEPAE